MAGVIYVMARSDSKEIRVGHHTTTNKQREREVNVGTGEKWTVVFSIGVGTKLKAEAVEHDTHALLEKHALRRRATNGSKPLRLVYLCSKSTAQKTIEKAIDLLNKELKIIAVGAEGR